MHRILFLSLLGCFFQVSAQSLVWNTEWGGTLDDRVSGCVENADQSLTFSAATAANDGDVSLNHGEWDGWIFQVDAQGGLMWEKTFGGSQEDYLNALVATPDGGWVACGQSNSSDGDISQNQGSFDVWVLKLNADASIAWSKTFGGADYEAATQIQVWDSTFIIAGYTYSLDGDVVGAKGGRDAWVFQLSEAGDWIWGKVLGGSGEDKITAIEVDSLIYFVGETSSSDGDIPSNKGVLDVWQGAIDSQGNLLSSHTWGGTKGDYGIRTCHDMAGCQYLGGNSYSSDGDIWGINKGNLDIWVMKKSAGGQVLWSHNFGGV